MVARLRAPVMISAQSGAWLIAHQAKAAVVPVKTPARGRSTHACPRRSARRPTLGVTTANSTAPAADTTPAVPYRPVTETISMTWAMLSMPIGIRPMKPGIANWSTPRVLSTAAYRCKPGLACWGCVIAVMLSTLEVRAPVEPITNPWPARTPFRKPERAVHQRGHRRRRRHPARRRKGARTACGMIRAQPRGPSKLTDHPPPAWEYPPGATQGRGTRSPPPRAPRWPRPAGAETGDGSLNDSNGGPVTPQTAKPALDSARSGPLEEGSVGGGTGMNCYGFKGGTGTSSRQVRVGARRYMVGALMQANFGSRNELVVAGRYLGRMLSGDNPMEETDWLALAAPPGGGSCITVVATDAPLLPGQCKALARRVPFGLARTGTTGSHFSGDLFLAFSATNVGMLDSSLDARDDGDALPSIEFVPSGQMDPLYEAVVQCAEECVLNVLAASTTMVGRDGHRSPGFPVERLGPPLPG